MRSRRFISTAGLAALAAMLFAQAAVALAACTACSAQPHAGMLAMQNYANVSCHEASEKKLNLCVARCQNAVDQALDKHQIKVPDVVFHAVRVVLAPSPSVPNAAATRVPALAAGPPARILFRSLLI